MIFKNKPNKYDVIVHIGTPKAGSSALQYFLLSNRNLLSEFGYYYPVHGVDENKVSGGHSSLGQFLKENNVKAAEDIFKEHLSDAKNEKKTLLMSSESFFIYPEKLREISSSVKIKIQAFFRDPIDSAVSSYNQSVKRHFATATFKSYIKNLIKTEYFYLSGEIFERWFNEFGFENVSVVAYERSIFPEGKIEKKFLEILGINKKYWNKFNYPSRPVNRGYSLGALELKRLLNLVLDKENENICEKIEMSLQKYSDDFRGEYFKPSDLIEKDVYNILVEKFKNSNKFVVSKILKEVPEGFLKYRESDHNNKLPYYLSDSPKDVYYKVFFKDINITDYIHSKFCERAEHKDITFDILKLGEFLQSDFDLQNLKCPTFTDHQVKILLSENSNMADFFRELAVSLERTGKIEEAYKAISRSLEIRPKGVLISKIFERIEAKVKFP